jgi:dihydrofolate synthase/folylpolyglutamate synthase
LAVVEVGLGGRLDAANALPAPEVCVITSIGHDHREWLGPTLKEIYFEKRGIARPGVPLVQAPPRSLRSAGDRDLFERGVPFWTLDRDVRGVSRGTDWTRRRQTFDVFLPGAKYAGIETGLLGGHQVRNGALALAVCHRLRRRGWPLSEEAIRAGFARAQWPGRFQVVRRAGGPDVILDGAHNREAAESLATAYRASPWGRRPATMIFGCLKDKDVAAMVRILKPLARRVFLVPLPTPRSRTTDELRRWWKGIETLEASSVAEAAEDAFRRARSDGGPVLAAGSLYLVGEVMKVLRRTPS